MISATIVVVGSAMARRWHGGAESQAVPRPKSGYRCAGFSTAKARTPVGKCHSFSSPCSDLTPQSTDFVGETKNRCALLFTRLRTWTRHRAVGDNATPRVRGPWGPWLARFRPG